MDETIDLNVLPATPPCTPPAETMVLPPPTPTCTPPAETMVLPAATPPTPTMEAPRSTWRKKSSQKGKSRLRLARHWRIKKPKPSSVPSKKKDTSVASKKKTRKKREAAGDGADERRPPVRRKLDLDGEPKSSPVRRKPDLVLDGEPKFSKMSTPLGSFSRATLMDSLRSLAKLDLRYYSRAQLMDNLRSLASHNNLLPLAVAAADTIPAADEQGSKRKRKNKVMRANQLKLVPFTPKQAAAAKAAEDPFIHMALVPRGGKSSALMYAPRWINVAMAPPDAKTLRELVLTAPAIDAAHRELMRMEETCLGEDLGDMPEDPELEAERRRLEALVDQYMEPVRKIIGKREFSNWEGSVVTSVVGTFLTQNVGDMLSSNAFMNVAAKFSFVKNESNVVETTNVDGCDQGVSKLSDEGIEELIASLRTGEISNWDKDRIMKVLLGRFEKSTAKKISQDIASFVKNDTSHWRYLTEEAYKNGYQKEEINETIDWETLLHAPFVEIEECIRDRGTQSQLVFRILLFLIRIKRDHGSINLEWLRYIPRAKAKEFLLSIIGLGYKSVDCIRLLSLRHRAFPVDTNVARIVTRLGWVPLKPLDNSLEFYMVDKDPVMAAIQRYLEPLLCNIPTHKAYELHCQQITFGKSICTKQQPNCSACPFTTSCKYYGSLFQSARLALLESSQQDARGQTNMNGGIHCDLLVPPSHEQMHQRQIEMGKGTERCNTEPIIEMPLTPLHEYPESSNEEELLEPTSEDEYVHHDYIGDIEDIDAHYDEEIDLVSIKHTESATTGPAHGTDMILIHPQDDSIPMITTYRLRTERLAYIIPDGHEILDKFEPRVPGDCNPYLLIIRYHDAHIVSATILIPCRTANRGIFPLDGTYFQKNEVFADHSSTSSPVQLKREVVCYFKQCKVYFGTSIHSVTKGQTHTGIKEFYHSGYMCTREFNRSTRRPTVLSAELHATKAQKETGKKRSILEPNASSGGRQ